MLSLAEAVDASLSAASRGAVAEACARVDSGRQPFPRRALKSAAAPLEVVWSVLERSASSSAGDAEATARAVARRLVGAAARALKGGKPGAADVADRAGVVLRLLLGGPAVGAAVGRALEEHLGGGDKWWSLAAAEAVRRACGGEGAAAALREPQASTELLQQLEKLLGHALEQSQWSKASRPKNAIAQLMQPLYRAGLTESEVHAWMSAMGKIWRPRDAADS